ncbi:WYL domain-containing protein [Nocardioides flavescens]|uniref:WYL domain-containing protein n=1 Tax=Nocardioides flavescens TaxID=2691959 RepID=A0A6L7EXQ8_9ACTN|nr:WYL domain-containing protein [Nocardioides flavescens]
MPSPSSRMLSLLSLLQVRRDWPGALIAERLGVSERTVRRDVDRLRELGYRVRAVKGPDGGYRLEPGGALPPLLFDDEQAVALAVALRVAAASGADVGEDALRALATVRQVLPTRLRLRVDAVSVTTVGAPGPAVDPDVLLVLAVAARDHEVLRASYPDRDGELQRRRVEPHHVVARAGRWYLLAWDLDRADWRTFRVDRLVPHPPTGPRFVPREVPGGDVAAFVAGRFRGSTSGSDWPCRGSAVMALPAAEVAAYAGDGVVESLGPDRCRLDLGSWSWTGLAASLARFGADLSEVEPAELRAAFADLGRRCVAASAP